MTSKYFLYVRTQDAMIMGADFYESEEQRQQLLASGGVPLGIGAGSVITNAIIDKNARVGKVREGSAGAAQCMLDGLLGCDIPLLRFPCCPFSASKLTNLPTRAHHMHACCPAWSRLTLPSHSHSSNTTTQNVKILNKEGINERMDDASGIYIRSGIVVITKGATVPDNTVI